MAQEQPSEPSTLRDSVLDAGRVSTAWLRKWWIERRPSLRARLLFTLLGLLAVLVALQAVQHFAYVDSLKALQSEEHQRAAVAAANGFSASLEQIFRRQETIAAATLGDRMSAIQIEAYLNDLLDPQAGLRSIQVVTPMGIRYGAPAPWFRPRGGRDPILDALTRTNPRHVSRVYSRAGEAEPAVRIASLAVDPAGIRGAVMMEFAAPSLGRLLPAAEGGHVRILVDGTGTPVARTAGNTRFVPPAALREAVEQARFWRRPVTLTRIAGAAAPVPGTDWTLVDLPAAASMEQIARNTRASMVSVAMIVIVLALAVLLIVQMSLKPVVTLSAAARLLGSGDLTLRVPPAEVREFEPLVEAFNRMAGQLQAARDALVEANRDLEERVRERTRALEAEHQKVLRAERLSTLGLLSSAIAHDLRNPLNTLKLSLQWFSLRLRDSEDQKLKERLGAMEREVVRAERIIQTLLSFARTGVPEREPTDVNALVREVVEVVEAPERIVVRLDLDRGAPPVSMDRAQMFQVLENLVRNAIQVMPERGDLWIATRVGPATCAISVMDSGPGIPPEMHESVFEPLVSAREGGTGLGLALCRRIVEAHGGRIWVESAAGQGATFRVELPLSAPPGPPPEGSPPRGGEERERTGDGGDEHPPPAGSRPAATAAGQLVR